MTVGQASRAAALAQVERILSDYQVGQGIPGLSAAIWMDDGLVWSKGFGCADLENRVPALPETLYRSASIGKMLTATAVMRLVERGELELDADIRSWCPAFPVKPWPITPRELLAHLSGIRHYGGPHDEEEQYGTHPFATVGEAMAVFQDDPLRFEPGTDYLYSTYGYVVLGCVIEGAAHESYLDAMRELVFLPAGMSATRDDDPRAILANRAAGYVNESGRLRNARAVDMSNRMPAGGFVTTVEDLARFAGALLEGRLVSHESLRAMMTPPTLKNGDSYNYGLGMGLLPADAQPGAATMAFHGGSSPGVSGMLLLVPARGLAVAILTNLEDASLRTETALAIQDALSRE